MTITVEVVRATSADLESFAGDALARLEAHRGGTALERDMYVATGSNSTHTLIEALIEHDGLVAGYLDESLVALGALGGNPRSLMGLFVDPAHRRHGIASAMVRDVMARTDAPIDAWALPGDRATKSLIESLGWKARRLTMRAE